MQGLGARHLRMQCDAQMPTCLHAVIPSPSRQRPQRIAFLICKCVEGGISRGQSRKCMGSRGRGRQRAGRRLRAQCSHRGAGSISSSGSPNNSPVEVLSSELLIDDFLRVRRDTLRLPDGSIHPYLSVSARPLAVAVIAVTDDGRVVVTREYRHPVRAFVLGLPGGVVDEGETAEEAAVRELKEETGLIAVEARVVGACHALPGIWAQQVQFVLARVPHEATRLPSLPSRLGTEALMSVALLPVADVEAIILQQQPYQQHQEKHWRQQQEQGEREEGQEGVERLVEVHTDALLMAGLWVMRSVQEGRGAQER